MEISRLNSARRTMSIEYIVKKISTETGVRIEELKRRGSKRNHFREIAIYLCYMNCNKTNQELGEYFGGIDTSSVSTIIRRIKEKMIQDASLRELFKAMEKML
jgi:chromosomal replication initiation ATPase DnaA